MIKHSQSTQSNKFAISLQYLKKEVRKGVHFLHADEQSFYKLGLLFLMEVAGYVESNQIIFVKSIAAAFVFYFDAKHSDILQGSRHVIVIYLFPCTARLEVFCLDTSIQ